MALKKTCTCGKIIEYSQKYCNECEIRRQQFRAQRNKNYDKYVRDKESAAFYNSTEWEKARAEVLRKFKGLDLYEYYINKKIVYADTAHHIIELKENWNKRLEISNLFPLSFGNHSMIHKLYEKDKIGTQKLLYELLKRWENEFG